MRVTRRDRIADPEELKRIALELRYAGNQPRIVHSPPVTRSGLQGEVDLVIRQGAVIDDDLVDATLLSHSAIVAADYRQQRPVGACDFLEAERYGESDIELLQGTHVRDEIHGHDLRREGP